MHPQYLLTSTSRNVVNLFTRLDIIHMNRDWASDRADGIFNLERRRRVGFERRTHIFTSTSPNVVNPFT
jgi:hypothetical protein